MCLESIDLLVDGIKNDNAVVVYYKNIPQLIYFNPYYWGCLISLVEDTLLYINVDYDDFTMQISHDDVSLPIWFGK